MKTVCIAALLMVAVMASAPAPALAALHAAPRSSQRSTRPKADQLSEAYSFEQYEADFAKRYATPAERQMRKELFEQRLGDILNHNRAGMHMWKKGVNHLTDLTEDERRSRRGHVHPTRVDRSKLKHAKPYEALKEALKSSTKAPSSLDWRTASPPVLTGVKDQGNCGDCWAHAATEAIESSYALKTGVLNALSQQQITSCTPNPKTCGGTGGCLGATIELAYEYVINDAMGITQEWEYGFTSYMGDSGKCKFNSVYDYTYSVLPKGYFVTTPNNDPTAAMHALEECPLAIAADASGWDEYESGVFHGCDYAKNITIDHGIMLVGYGTDEELGVDYWIVRNSWGAYWGEEGYIKLYKEPGKPECGWSVDWPTAGLGCEGGPNQVWTCGQCGLLYQTSFTGF